MIRLDPRDIIKRHQGDAPVNLIGIASDLGTSVTYVAMTDDIAGLIKRDSSTPSKFAIEINSLHHGNRQRFTLAHEIAHFVMRRDLIQTISSILLCIVVHSAMF